MQGNNLALAQEKLQMLGQAGMIAGLDEQLFAQFAQDAQQIVAEDPVLSQMLGQGGISKYLNILRSQAAQSQAQEILKNQQGNLSWLSGQVKESENVPSSFWNFMAPQMWGAAGQTDPSLGAMAMQQKQRQPDFAQVDTVQNGQPVTQFVDKNRLQSGQSFPQYQKPNYDLYAAPGQSPMAINMTQPADAPVKTQLPPNSARMGTPATNINVSTESSGIFPTFQDAERWAAQYNSDPKNQARTAKANFNTKGQPIVEITDRELPSQGERETKAKNQAAIAKVREFEVLIDENLTGPIQGRLTKLKNEIGIGDTPDSQALQVMAESMIREVYGTAGKQLSDKELTRLVGYFPIDISVADEKFRQQFRIFKDELLRSIELSGQVQGSLGMNTGAPVNTQDPNAQRIQQLIERKRQLQGMQ
jgi:hypothetical protein